MILGHSFKSGGLRSRSKDVGLSVGLLCMDLTICDVIGEPQCRYLHLMDLITSFIHLMKSLST